MTHWSLFSPDRRIATAQRRTMMASLICIVWSAVAVFASQFGKASPQGVTLLLAYNATGVILVNLGIRLGWTRKLQDIGLTQFQMVFAVISMCGVYALVPPVRAAAIQTMCLALVFATFSLTAEQCIRLGYVLAAIPLLTLAALRAHDPDTFSMTQDGTPALGAALIILIMSRMLSLFCRLRQRLLTQRQELQALAAQVEGLAQTDELTGLANRRAMTEQAELALARHARSGTPLCLALIDVDHFKRVNDQHGHHVGDEVLGALARTLREGLRTTDLLARWGGEEFLVVLPDANAESAQVVLHRVLDRLPGLVIASSSPSLRVSFSAGVAQLQPGEDLTAMLRRADQALYEAKAQGRCRVLIAP